LEGHTSISNFMVEELAKKETGMKQAAVFDYSEI
jgi:hypothetical protein